MFVSRCELSCSCCHAGHPLELLSQLQVTLVMAYHSNRKVFTTEGSKAGYLFLFWGNRNLVGLSTYPQWLTWLFFILACPYLYPKKLNFKWPFPTQAPILVFYFYFLEQLRLIRRSEDNLILFCFLVFRQDLSLIATNVSVGQGDVPASAFPLPVGVLALQTWATACGFLHGFMGLSGWGD